MRNKTNLTVQQAEKLFGMKARPETKMKPKEFLKQSVKKAGNTVKKTVAKPIKWMGKQIQKDMEYQDFVAEEHKRKMKSSGWIK